MAWLWWLLAPLASTLVGVLVMAARARRESRHGGGAQDAMSQHRRLVQALAGVSASPELPPTMIVLDPETESTRS